MFSFVILHYKNLRDTQECVESIKNYCNGYKYSIIIVVNSITDKKELSELKKINTDLVVSEKNLGFAKGNNLGCEYAIKKYNPDFLCVLNNDILITNKNFLKTIKEESKKYNFDMMGPKIVTCDGDSVNPFPVYKNVNDIKKAIKKSKRLIKIYNNNILRNLLKIYIKLKSIVFKKKRQFNGDETVTGVALHGCAIIFSKKYYTKYKDVFCNNTFLFHEEEFLYYRMKRDNLISLYSKELEVFHKEGASLNSQFKNDEYRKQIFKNQNIIDSLEKLLETI